MFDVIELGVGNDGDGLGPFAGSGRARMLLGLFQELHEGGRRRSVDEIGQGQAFDAPVHGLVGNGPGRFGPVADEDAGDAIGLELDEQFLDDDIHQVVIIQPHGDALDEIHQPLLIREIKGMLQIGDFQFGEDIHQGGKLLGQALVLRLQLPALELDIFFQLVRHIGFPSAKLKKARRVSKHPGWPNTMGRPKLLIQRVSI